MQVEARRLEVEWRREKQQDDARRERQRVQDALDREERENRLRIQLQREQEERDHRAEERQRQADERHQQMLLVFMASLRGGAVPGPAGAAGGAAACPP